MGRKRPRAGKFFYFCAAGLIFLFLVGCNTWKKEFISKQEVYEGKTPTKEEPLKDAWKGLLRAKELFDLGDYPGALKENQKVLSLSGKKSPRDQALFNMGLIYAHAENPQRDIPKALHLFRKILKDYPGSPLTVEAKVFAGVLQENEKLNQTVEKSKQVDIEVEEKKREKAR